MSDDEKLIECVRNYPVLYDLACNKYMDISFKNRIWKKIGEELNSDGAACKSRWNNIRDTYRKSLKRNATKSGQGSKNIKQYKYSELLSFLKKFSFEERESISNIESEEDTPHTREETDDSLLHAQEETDDSLLQEGKDDSRPKMCPPNQSPKKKKRKLKNEQTTASKLMEYIISKETVQPQHPVDTFLASIASTLKTFSPYHLHLAKAEIFNTVQKYEYEEIMGNQGI